MNCPICDTVMCGCASQNEEDNKINISSGEDVILEDEEKQDNADTHHHCA